MLHPRFRGPDRMVRRHYGRGLSRGERPCPGAPTLRAAVERKNDDGSIVLLVAFRSTVSQVGMADRENSYRLRVKMVPEDGQFKIAELDQAGEVTGDRC